MFDCEEVHCVNCSKVCGFSFSNIAAGRRAESAECCLQFNVAECCARESCHVASVFAL